MATILEQEIRDQGAALSAREAAGWEQAKAAAALLRREDVDYLLIAARGSSDNAARYAQYLFGLEDGLAVGLAAPWLYGHGHRPPRLRGAAVMAISQSGRSPDIAGVLAAARAQERPTIAITNDHSSPLAKEADVIVDLAVGEERSVAATKTFTSSLHAVAQIAAALGDQQKHDEMFSGIGEIVDSIAQTHLDERKMFDPLAKSEHITSVGRGLDFAISCESAIKLRELTGTLAEAFSPPDLLHGPVAALHHSTGFWAVSSTGETEPETLEVLRNLTERTGTSVIVSGDPQVLELADIPISVPTDGMPAWATALVAVVPAQVAALRLAELAGVEIDTPLGLSKVTLTN